jgi:hypothetical protein
MLASTPRATAACSTREFGFCNEYLLVECKAGPCCVHCATPHQGNAVAVAAAMRTHHILPICTYMHFALYMQNVRTTSPVRISCGRLLQFRSGHLRCCPRHAKRHRTVVHRCHHCHRRRRRSQQDHAPDAAVLCRRHPPGVGVVVRSQQGHLRHQPARRPHVLVQRAACGAPRVYALKRKCYNFMCPFPPTQNIMTQREYYIC